MLRVLIPYMRPEPHIACILVDEAIGDDRLLRTEMICALCLIRRQMRRRAYKDHQIIPVRFLAPQVMINADAQRFLCTLSPVEKLELSRCILTASKLFPV